MEKIKSFQIDHTKLGIGMYVSRVDGDIVTYDVRMCKPNGGKYLSDGSMHTIEHLFATYARNSALSQGVVYVGPMGCRTGFYFLTRGISGADAIALVRDSLGFIHTYEGRIPGDTEAECGNYRDHDLPAARLDVLPLFHILQDYTEEMLQYDWHFSQV